MYIKSPMALRQWPRTASYGTSLVRLWYVFGATLVRLWCDFPTLHSSNVPKTWLCVGEQFAGIYYRRINGCALGPVPLGTSAPAEEQL